jgi:hypothetical protein
MLHNPNDGHLVPIPANEINLAAMINDDNLAVGLCFDLLVNVVRTQRWTEKQHEGCRQGESGRTQTRRQTRGYLRMCPASVLL